MGEIVFNCFKSFLRNILIISIFSFSISLFAYDEDKEFFFIPKGYVQFDHIFWKGDKSDDFLSGALLKSTDLFVKGHLSNSSLNYFVHFNFLNTSLKSNLSQAYVQYSTDVWSFKIGQIIIPFGLEKITDPCNRVFMECSLLKGVLEDKYFGLNGEYRSDFYVLSASIVVPDLGDSFSRAQDNKYSFLFRGYINPIRNINAILHLGFNYRLIKKHIEEISPPSVVSFRDAPSFNSVNSLLNSHSSVLPRHYTLGVELAGVLGPLFLQSEYVRIKASWRDYEKETYYSWYMQVSCILTGEHHLYDRVSGSFLDPNPQSSFGAFEISVRYSYVNLLNECSLLRGVSNYDGEKDAFVFGINWIFNKSLKMQINYAYEDFKYRVSESDNRKVSGIGLRIQFLF
ncbi:MAG TPA: porin [Candidatus Azoamicus sp. OHIO1]